MKFLVTALFILLDIITGTLWALMSHTWTSKQMREGGFHKISIILFIALACLCDYGQRYLNLGFEIPITYGVLVYVCLMEIGSSIENITKINPQFKGKIKQFFKVGDKN